MGLSTPPLPWLLPLWLAQNPTSNASYSSSLFDAWNANRKECSILIPSGDSNITMMLDPWVLMPHPHIFSMDGLRFVVPHIQPYSRGRTLQQSLTIPTLWLNSLICTWCQKPPEWPSTWLLFPWNSTISVMLARGVWLGHKLYISMLKGNLLLW